MQFTPWNPTYSIGSLIALLTLIIVIILMMTGQMAVWPIGIILCALCLARLL